MVLPFIPSTGMSSFPEAPLRTFSTDATASGSATSAASAATVVIASTREIKKGKRVKTVKRVRERSSPSRTASVRLPAAASVGMSRMLLARLTDAEIAPMASAHRKPSHVTRPDWVYSVPITATRPKKMNTDTSPSPE